MLLDITHASFDNGDFIVVVAYGCVLRENIPFSREYCFRKIIIIPDTYKKGFKSLLMVGL
jgi:hypothetical protein